MRLPPPPFITSHQLKRLVLRDGQHRTAREILRKGRDERLGDGGDARNDAKWSDDFWETMRLHCAPSQGPRELWEMADRLSLFKSLQYKKIVITVDGGFGKSIALQQLQYVRQHYHPNHLVLRFDLADLPKSADQFFDRPYRHETIPFLPHWMYSRMRHSVVAVSESFAPVSVSVASLGGWLISLASRGQLTLMVDGLDQAERKAGEQRIEALNTVLQWYPQIHCVAAGRPSAIEEYWLLFSSNGLDASEWEFWIVPEFDDQEIATYIGASRYERLRTLGAAALFVPRTLEVVRTLTDDEFQDCHFAADVYFKSIQRTLRLDADQHRSAGWHIFNPSQILDFFSAIAYLLLMWKGGPILQVESETDFHNLTDALDACLPKSLRNGLSVKEVFSQLASINANAIDFAFWQGIDVRSLRWRNSTLRDFLAAVWLLKGASPMQLEAFEQHQSDQTESSQTETRREEQLLATWKFVSQMPIDELEREYGARQVPSNFLHMVGRLFEKRNSSRPTALMYLAWPGLLRLAKNPSTGMAFLIDNYSQDESRMVTATCQAQKWVQTYTGPSSLPLAPACSVLLKFLREYIELKKNGDPEIGLFEASFQPIPAGQFLYGFDRETNSIAHPFKLSAFQVWNSLYERFDKFHKESFSDYEKFSPYARGAAINKTWYDSWMFALWAHSYLPNELEWEAACRGRIGDLAQDHHTEYCYGKGASQLGKYAWHGDNSAEYEFHIQGSPLTLVFWSRLNQWILSMIGSQGRPHAHTVGRKKSNSYGLFDVHGNVREWTASWYDMRQASRSLRGGSFSHDCITYARCAYRDFSYPADAINTVGFRCRSR